MRRTLTAAALTLALLFGGLSVAPSGQAAITRGFGLVADWLYFNGTTSASPALKRSGTSLHLKLADDSAFANLRLLGVFSDGYTGSSTNALLISGTAPTIGSGFGTSPSIVANNGTAAFTVNVGTGGVATSGVLTLPAATTGWNCFVIDRTNNTVTRETATTTTSATLTAASAWAASDILQVSCFGY